MPDQASRLEQSNAGGASTCQDDPDDTTEDATRFMCITVKGQHVGVAALQLQNGEVCLL